MKLLMMFFLLHTTIVIQAAPIGSDTARRASIAESSVIVTQGTYPDSSSMGNFWSFSSKMLESGSTAAGSVTSSESALLNSLCNLHVRCSVMTAPTGTLLTAPTTINELYNTCAFKISDIDETSLKVYMVGIILSTSFAAIALIVVSVLTCSVGRCVKKFARKNCGYSEKLSCLQAKHCIHIE